MPVSKAKKYKVIPNPELLAAGRGFIPAFGNAEDLDIFNRIIELDKSLQTVDNTILRGKNPDLLTEKMKRILREEKFLIHSITKRNMDF